MHYGYMELIHLANDSFQWQILVNNLIKCRIQYKWEIIPLP